MTNVGVSEDFSLKIDGLKNIYSVKALVCWELSDPINVGTGFQQKMSTQIMPDAMEGKKQENSNNPTLTFYKNGVTLTRGDKSMPLIQTLREEQEKQEGAQARSQRIPAKMRRI